MIKGDKCWIVENGIRVISAEIVSFSGNLVLIKTQDGKGLRLPKHRIYNNQENAEEFLQERKLLQKEMSTFT